MPEVALPPGPDLPTAVQTWYWLRKPQAFMDECAARYGDLITIRLQAVPTPLLLSADPELNRQIFAGDPLEFLAGQANLPLKPFLGANSLLMLDGVEHHRQRKLMTPAFHGDRVQTYGRAMIAVTRDNLRTWPVGRPFPVHQHLQEITLRIIVRTVFGFHEGERAESITALFRGALEIATMPGLLLPLLQREGGPLLRRITPWGRLQAYFRQANQMLREEVDRRQADAGAADKADALALLLAARDEAGQPLSFDELRDELLTLLVAGHETTATSLAWALVHLLQDPAVLADLQDELRGVGPDPEPERLARLPLLDAVVRETLRLQPVVPLVGRVLREPQELAGRRFPAGVLLAPSIYLTQRRPDLYPRPDRFLPERFLVSVGGRTFGPGEWLPFGGGARRCLGAAFATYEMKLVLATLLTHVDLSLVPGARYDAVRRSVTLTPRGGAPVIASRVSA